MSRENRLRICVLGTRGIPGVQGGIEKFCEKIYPLFTSKIRILICNRKEYIQSSFYPRKFQRIFLIYLNSKPSKHFETLLHTLWGFLICFRRIHTFHVHAIGPGLLIPLMRLMGTKVVFIHHGHDYNRRKWGRFAKGLLWLGEQFGYLFANRVVFINPYHLENAPFYVKHKASYILAGMPSLSKASYVELKKDYIFFCGRLVPEKGLTELLEAYSILRQEPEFSHYNLKIAGSAGLGSEVYAGELIERGKQIDGVEFLGHCTKEQLDPLYRECKVFILPSFHEGLPLVGLEALSFGAPLCLSNIDEHQIFKLFNANFFNPSSIDSIVGGLKSSIKKSRKKAEVMEGLDRAELMFSWNKAAGLLEKATLELL